MEYISPPPPPPLPPISLEGILDPESVLATLERGSIPCKRNVTLSFLSISTCVLPKGTLCCENGVVRKTSCGITLLVLIPKGTGCTN